MIFSLLILFIDLNWERAIMFAMAYIPILIYLLNKYNYLIYPFSLFLTLDLIYGLYMAYKKNTVVTNPIRVDNVNKVDNVENVNKISNVVKVNKVERVDEVERIADEKVKKINVAMTKNINDNPEIVCAGDVCYIKQKKDYDLDLKAEMNHNLNLLKNDHGTEHNNQKLEPKLNSYTDPRPEPNLGLDPEPNLDLDPEPDKNYNTYRKYNDVVSEAFTEYDMYTRPAIDIIVDNDDNDDDDMDTANYDTAVSGMGIKILNDDYNHYNSNATNNNNFKIQIKDYE